MIADSSKPNKLQNVTYIHNEKHGEERHHPKTESLLYQNQSHRVYHKFKEKQIHLQQKDVSLKRGLRYLWCMLYSTVVQTGINLFDHAFKIRIARSSRYIEGELKASITSA